MGGEECNFHHVVTAVGVIGITYIVLAETDCHAGRQHLLYRQVQGPGVRSTDQAHAGPTEQPYETLHLWVGVECRGAGVVSQHTVGPAMRGDSWVEPARTWGPVDAALSTTAMHWLSPAEQAGFFARLASLLRPGGLFVNGDHLSFDRDQQRIGAAARALQEEEAGRDAVAHPAETWGEWWHAVESEPGFAALAEERRSRWGGHPDYHSPGQALAMQASLRQAGFSEVGTVWQHYENRVVVAIR